MHQSYLSHNRVEDCKPMQTREARTLLRNLVGSPPEKYETFLSRYEFPIVAGHQITCDDDPYLRMANMVYEAMSKTGPPGGSPLDFFPLLQYFPPWFPGASHVGVIRTWRPILRELYEYSLRTVKAQKVRIFSSSSGLVPLMTVDRKRGRPRHRDDDEDLKGAAATMFGAGESTTWSTLSIFCQAKAQKEIDSVVGDLRLPKFEDRGNLPFVEAVLQETFRRASTDSPRLTAILEGVPHRAMEDDVYNGMYIPRGALVFANVRGMSLDEIFSPERYLPKPAGAGELHFSHISFGFGRRVCAGQYLADNSLWIAIVSILATFTIANAVDENGTIMCLKVL
ncbi:cytochrome P450 1A2 [Mycena olivaceomarginata]|nr:cytochrome P450 1A2 [Mycena olivaceomarginata]